jgi:uncharacterized RDD family membrane protein YckC
MTEPQSAASPYGPGYGAQATTQLAGFWRRLVAYIIDAIIVGIAAAVVEAIIGAIVHASGIDATGTGVRGGLVTLVIGLLYFGYLWSRDGQTVGYMALGMRLVRVDGQPVTFLLGMLRYLLIYLSFAICLIPAIISAFMIGLGGRKQAIHDLIAGTLVLRA